MSNNLAGLSDITLGDKTHTLRFDWNGIAELTQLFPDGYNLMDPKHLSQILAIGLRHEMADITADQVMGMSPPIIPTMESVGAAINCAYFGTSKAPEVEDKPENPQKRPVAKRVSDAH
jgi:hypothetical protein